MSSHARLSPSSAHRWMACAGSVFLESGLPDTSSKFADEGTAAHLLASECLSSGGDASAFLGETIVLWKRPESHSEGTDWLANFQQASLGPDIVAQFEVGIDMAAAVQVYLDNVREAAIDGELLVEQRVNFSAHVGVPDQFGTADAIVLKDSTLQVHDLKYGRGVRVDAEANEQMMLYALGALDSFGALGDIDTVQLAIHQPRLQHLSRWQMPVAELLEFAQRAKQAAAKAMDIVETGIVGDEDLHPGESQCRFCKAKATCPKLAAQVQDAVGADFEDLTQPSMASALKASIPICTADHLAKAMSAVDLIEGWCKAVRAETERRLLAGTPVDGWKLVQGKRGNRKWADEKAAEDMLRSMRVKHDQMYDYKLISPTAAEKLHKAGDIGTRQWPKLQQLITQSEGGPSVAPASDPREPLVLRSADDFEPVPEPAAGADLV